MSMERRPKQPPAPLTPGFAPRASRAGAALGVALVVGTISFMAVRQWRLDHAPAEPLGQLTRLDGDAPLEAESLLCERPSPLLADRLTGRVGMQVKPLQPVEGAVILAPTLEVDAGAPADVGVRALLTEEDASVSAEWLAAILKGDRARHSWDGATASTATAAGASPIAAPGQAAPGAAASPPRSWDRGDTGPSFGPISNPPGRAEQPAGPIDQTPREADAAIVDGAEETPPAAAPKGRQFYTATAPTEEPSASSEKARDPERSPLLEAVYADQISALLKPIAQIKTTVALPKVAPPQGSLDPDVPDKNERPKRQRASELFAAEPVQFHGAGGIRTRPWPDQVAVWEASGIAYHPLCFEEINLERYGYSFGIAQPVVSAAHFFGRIPALPYLMTVDPPHRCVYTLGHYRPGSCAPLAWNIPPFDPLAAAVQGGVVTGLVYLIP